MTMQPDTLPPLTRKAAAAILTASGYPVSPETLASMATRGGGPPYQVFGRYALYQRDQLIAWAQARVRAPTAAACG